MRALFEAGKVAVVELSGKPDPKVAVCVTAALATAAGRVVATIELETCLHRRTSILLHR